MAYLNGASFVHRGVPPQRPPLRPHKVDLHIGSRIRLRRAELKISQQELADEVGVAVQQIQKYEVGRNRVSAGRLHGIARALGVTVSYLFQGLDVPAELDQQRQASLSSLPRLVNDPSMIRFLRTISEIEDKAVRDRAVEIVSLVAAGAQTSLLVDQPGPFGPEKRTGRLL